jgi:hypothetical protein
MPDANILVPLEFDGAGRTGVLTVKIDADLEPGFHGDTVMRGIAMHGFLPTAKLAYRVALCHYGLSAGLSIKWCLVPRRGGRFPGFQGGSAGAAFLLALIKLRVGDFNPRTLRRHSQIEEEIAGVRLEWLAASATIDSRGCFGPVDQSALLLKFQGLVNEQVQSGVRLAVISRQQTHIGSISVDPNVTLFNFAAGLERPLPVLRVANAEDCYRELFRLQSEQVLL